MTGRVNHSTLAVSWARDPNKFRVAGVDTSLLRNGRNVIAAEIHQNSASSPDLSFDLELLANIQPPPLDLVLYGSAWKFLDDGSDPGSASSLSKHRAPVFFDWQD